ncbi:MAG: dTDP-glucose 4,6-dehydratase [Phycisphaerae bacterium]|nr:dTDP-glucose 4,6-dehydratase [Phycisphaerae bacterium]
MAESNRSHLLVTGAAGFIGANFVRHRLALCPHERIVALDALTYAGNRANLAGLEDAGRMTFVQGDIRDGGLMERLLRDHGIGTIVHFAAESHVDRSISGPDAFIDTNIVGTHSLLKAARAVWLGATRHAHRFHHVSTDEVYGSLGAGDPAFAEENQYQPNSPYSASKAASDHLVRAYHHTFGLEVTTSNCSNNYGPYQFPEKLIPLMMVNILHGKPLPVYGDGMNVRDWLYVEDHCRGISLILDRGRIGEVYNIGGNNERPNIEIVNRLCAMIDERFARDPGLAKRFGGAPAAKGEKSASLITYVKDRPGHDRRYAIDARKAESELGYRPAETFETGFAKTIDWYLANEAWWRGVMDGSYRSWIETNYAHRTGSPAAASVA